MVRRERRLFEDHNMALWKFALVALYSSHQAAAAAAVAAPPSAPSSLVERYDHGLIGQQAEQALAWTPYDQVILIHAVCMFAAWQILAPLAVVIASVGRSWGKVWFKLHWAIQVLLVLPLTVAGGGLATYATRLSGNGSWHPHRILGTIVIGLAFLQVGIGYYSTLVSKKDSEQVSATASAPEVRKRTVSRWIHIFLGIALLTLSGLNITWGLAAYRALRPVMAIPLWIQIVHWVVAGIPLLIVGPFVVIRGLFRMRRGQSFAQAYFDRPVTPRYTPPRNFYLGGSTYRGAEGGEGHAYERGAGSEGLQLVSSGASVNSVMSRSTWDGHTTREEYELDIKASLAHTSEYDYAEATFEDDKSVLPPPTTSATPLPPRSDATTTAVASRDGTGLGAQVSAPAQAPPLPPYPRSHSLIQPPSASTPPLHVLLPPTAPLRIVRSPSNSEPQPARDSTSAVATPEVTISRQPSLPPILPDLLVSPITVSLPGLDDPSNPFPSSPLAPRPSLAQSLYSQTSAILSSISVANSPIDHPTGGHLFSGLARRGETEAEHEGSVLFDSSLESRPTIKSMSASVRESAVDDGREEEEVEETLVAEPGSSESAQAGDDEQTKMERAASGRWFGNR